jgi:hypothetical protein
MSFQVYISGSSSSAEEWRQALESPSTDLPKLTAEQKEMAKRFQVTEEEYARGVLAGKLSERRHAERGNRLGSKVEQILAVLGPGYRLDAILREGTQFRWVLRIETPTGIRNIAVPLDLADDVVDSGMADVVEQLKARVLQGLDRTELARNAK